MTYHLLRISKCTNNILVLLTCQPMRAVRENTYSAFWHYRFYWFAGKIERIRRDAVKTDNNLVFTSESSESSSLFPQDYFVRFGWIFQQVFLWTFVAYNVVMIDMPRFFPFSLTNFQFSHVAAIVKISTTFARNLKEKTKKKRQMNRLKLTIWLFDVDWHHAYSCWHDALLSVLAHDAPDRSFRGQRKYSHHLR